MYVYYLHFTESETGRLMVFWDPKRKKKRKEIKTSYSRKFSIKEKEIAEDSPKYIASLEENISFI